MVAKLKVELGRTLPSGWKLSWAELVNDGEKGNVVAPLSQRQKPEFWQNIAKEGQGTR
jgi:hypothetical protein